MKMQGPVKTRAQRPAPPHLSREMSKLLAQLAKKTKAMDPRLAGRWEEIAGPEFARLCRPVRIKPFGRARALEVAVANGAAAMQLQYRQDALIEKVNAFLGRGAIARLVIQQTGAAGMKPGTAPARPVYSRPQLMASADEAPDAPDDLGAALNRMRKLMETSR